MKILTKFAGLAALLLFLEFAFATEQIFSASDGFIWRDRAVNTDSAEIKVGSLPWQSSQTLSGRIYCGYNSCCSKQLCSGSSCCTISWCNMTGSPEVQYGGGSSTQSCTASGSGSAPSRGFLRFDLLQLANKRVFSAKLNLFVQSAAEGAVQIALIDDYGELDATDFDKPREGLGQIAKSTDSGRYVSIDVAEPLSQGATKIAFLLIEEPEQGAAFIFGSNESANKPYLLVEANEPPRGVLLQQLPEIVSPALPLEIVFEYSDTEQHKVFADISILPQGQAITENLDLSATSNCAANLCKIPWSPPNEDSDSSWLSIRLRDEFDAENEILSEKFSIDSSPPQNAKIESETPTNKKLPELRLYAEDLTEIKMRFSCDAKSWAEFVAFNPTYNNFDIASDTLGCFAADGARNVFVQFADVFSQTAEPVFSEIFLDTTPPKGLVLESLPSFTNKSDILLNWGKSEITDATGIGKFVVWRESQGAKTLLSELDNGTFSYVDNSSKLEGPYIYSLEIFDILGNSAISNSVSVLLDTLPPKFEIFSAKSNGEISFAASDENGSGISHTDLEIPGTDFKASTNEQHFTISGLATGTYAVLLRAFDKAGNFTDANLTFFYESPPITAPPLAMPPSQPPNNSSAGGGGGGSGGGSNGAKLPAKPQLTESFLPPLSTQSESANLLPNCLFRLSKPLFSSKETALADIIEKGFGKLFEDLIEFPQPNELKLPDRICQLIQQKEIDLLFDYDDNLATFSFSFGELKFFDLQPKPKFKLPKFVNSQKPKLPFLFSIPLKQATTFGSLAIAVLLAGYYLYEKTRRRNYGKPFKQIQSTSL